MPDVFLWYLMQYWGPEEIRLMQQKCGWTRERHFREEKTLSGKNAGQAPMAITNRLVYPKKQPSFGGRGPPLFCSLSLSHGSIQSQDHFPPGIVGFTVSQ